VQGDKTSAVVCAGGAGSGEAVRVSGRHSSQIPGDNRRWRAAEEDLEDNLLTGGARTVRSRPTGGTARALCPLGSGQRERERERAGTGRVCDMDRAMSGCRVRPTKRKESSIIQMYFSSNTEMKIILGKYLGTLENYENFQEGRFKYLAQLLYWAL
jgi:hypothetical protein